MNNIKVIERILSNLTFKKDFFVVESYPNYPSNRIGIDGSGNIVILVKTINLSQSFFNDINTQNLSIYFDKRCSICINETRTIEFYSILLLKDHSLVYYFINLFEILVHKLGEKPELSE